MPISDDPSRFAPGAVLLHEDGRELVVAASRPHHDRLLVTFEGIVTRDQAEAARGALYVDPSMRRDLVEDEFWEDEIVGCEVVGPDGEPLGKVIEVRPGAAQDLLVLATARGERFVPMVKAIVTSVDTGARRVAIDPPAGLLE